MAELLTFSSLAAFATLALLEIVLGIDNIVFLAILAGKLPEAQQAKARTLGLMLAAVGRIILLFAISWVITLDETKLLELPFAMPGAHGAVEAADGHAAAGAAEGGERLPSRPKTWCCCWAGCFSSVRAPGRSGTNWNRSMPKESAESIRRWRRCLCRSC